MSRPAEHGILPGVVPLTWSTTIVVDVSDPGAVRYLDGFITCENADARCFNLIHLSTTVGAASRIMADHLQLHVRGPRAFPVDSPAQNGGPGGATP